MVQTIVSVVSAVVTIVSVILAINRNILEMNAKLDKAQAVTDTKLDALTEEVRKHNNFAQKIPVIEMEVKEISKLERRLEKVEAYIIKQGGDLR